MANLDFSHSFQLTDGIFKTGAYRVPSKSITFGTNNYSLSSLILQVGLFRDCEFIKVVLGLTFCYLQLTWHIYIKQ
jgi:hypothetical protein